MLYFRSMNRLSLILACTLLLSGCATTMSDHVRATNQRAAQIVNLDPKLKEGLLADKISSHQNGNGDYLLMSLDKNFQPLIDAYHAQLLDEFFNKDETPEDLEQTIREGKISVGMTKPQVITSWGDPSDTSRIVTTNGVSEQWRYGFSEPRYLYFQDNILTAIQN